YAVCGLFAAGSLFGAFRWKVRLIQEQERRLRAQNDLLEAKVKARTDELANSVSVLQATLDSTADGVVALHFSGEIVSYNTRFTTMWNLPPEAMASDAALRDASARRTRDPKAFLARIDEIHTQEGEHFDVIELADGRVIERYCKPQSVDGRSVGIVMNFRDITERRRAEEALLASEGFLNSLVENLPVHIFRKDRAGRITFANRRYCERYGRCAADLLGKTAFDLRPHAEAERTEQDDQVVMSTGRPYEGVEIQTLPSGERRYIQIIKVPVLDSAGQCTGVQGMFLDVTEAKLAEARLAEASSLLEAMLDNTPDFIYFKDRESRFVRVSKALLARVPDPSQVHRLTDFDLFTAEHAQKAFNDEQEIMRTG
ncbi:MAG TPA: PAS domain-containing protein, partial [Opitutus sp.]|nr:PAS domain-containing protein [Opitutus sp.]